MGLADFLAEAGNRTAIGQVAQAFGGQTSRQKAVDDFINNQLPALADQVHKAATKDDVARAGQSLITGGLKAGINPQGLEKLMEMTIQPALQNLQTGELDKLRADYGAQPAQPAESRPQGTEGPLTPSGNFIDPKAATPEKPLDLNFAMRLGQATGANPDQFRQNIGMPADIAGKQLSNQKTQGAIDQEQAKEKAIGGLSNTPPAEGQPSLQATARINPAGIQQFLPVREDQAKQDYQNQLLGLKQQGLENTLSMAQQRIGAANDRADRATDRNTTRQATVLRKEFNTLSKNFRDVGDSYNRVEAATKSDDPMSQVAAIYNFIKMQDPNIVTGSEFQLIQNARPLLARYGLQAFERAWNGKKLDPAQMNQLRSTAKNLYEASGRQHQQRVQEYSRLAEQSDINPRDVVTEMGVQPAQAGQGGYSEGVPSGSAPTGQGQGGAPPVGTISKGYRFKGGNPADRNSWEKVQ